MFSARDPPQDLGPFRYFSASTILDSHRDKMNKNCTYQGQSFFVRKFIIKIADPNDAVFIQEDEVEFSQAEG